MFHIVILNTSKAFPNIGQIDNFDKNFIKIRSLEGFYKANIKNLLLYLTIFDEEYLSIGFTR